MGSNYYHKTEAMRIAEAVLRELNFRAELSTRYDRYDHQHGIDDRRSKNDPRFWSTEFLWQSLDPRPSRFAVVRVLTQLADDHQIECESRLLPAAVRFYRATNALELLSRIGDELRVVQVEKRTL